MGLKIEPEKLIKLAEKKEHNNKQETVEDQTRIEIVQKLE